MGAGGWTGWPGVMIHGVKESGHDRTTELTDLQLDSFLVSTHDVQYD